MKSLESAPVPVESETISTQVNGAVRASVAAFESGPTAPEPTVTLRAFGLGLVLSGLLAGLNAWIETLFNVHFLGGVQMPFGAVFGLLACLFLINGPLKALQKATPALSRRLPPLSSVELLTVYAMLVFAALISTPGTENFFITTGASLFYLSTRENHWADLFYRYVPRHFAPGWDGKEFQHQVIDPLYTGDVSFAQIPWHAWSVLLVAWGVFLLLVYASLFFGALVLRRQWIINEALSFPLVQLPLMMVETQGSERPPARAFWGNGLMWGGFVLAIGLHLLRGLNNYFPDWPTLSAFQGNPLTLEFTEKPWSVIGGLRTEFFLGGVAIAYLLTREVSLSFWVFFLLVKYQMILADQLGFAPDVLPKDSATAQPMFIAFQSVGAWAMMGTMLLWGAKGHLLQLGRDAWRGRNTHDEPFAPRTVVLGFGGSLVAVLAWCWFAGISPFLAACFFAIYLLSSLVLARLVVEGGLLFPKVTFAPIEVMTGGVGTSALSPSDLTKLTFLQPSLMGDTRTNLLPAFLHTLKIAHELKLNPRNVRRLLGSVVGAILVSLGVSVVVLISTLYSAGGLGGYTFFSYKGPQVGWTSLATTLAKGSGPDPMNVLWASAGAVLVYLLVLARSRFLWFPLHPLGYLVASSFSISRLWPSFFLGWLIKSLLLRFGGNETVVRFRPFMIGLILGNLTAMVLWMLFGFWKGTQIPFWPA